MYPVCHYSLVSGERHEPDEISLMLREYYQLQQQQAMAHIQIVWNIYGPLSLIVILHCGNMIHYNLSSTIT